MGDLRVQSLSSWLVNQFEVCDCLDRWCRWYAMRSAAC